MTKKSTHQQRGKSLSQRFEEKVDRSGNCWNWTSAIGSRGYGIFWVGGGISEMAHRVAYKLANGEIPEGKVVMHSCDNPRCVRPEHLSLGTIQDNALDAKKKGRLAVGERNGGGGKLTEKDVREIRSASGISEVARRFGVSKQTIKAIRRRRIWAHVA